MSKFYLPTDLDALYNAIRQLLTAAEPTLNIRKVTWQLVQHYLQGVRDFDAINYSDGTVRIGYYDQEGRLRFKLEDLIPKLQTELGRLYRMDLSPAVEKKSFGLDSIRQASISQMVLDDVLPDNKLDLIKLDALPPFLRFGTLGLYAYEDTDHTGRIVPEIEIVMPWELVPIPAEPQTTADICGLMRHRWVTLDWLRKHSMFKKKSAAEIAKILDGVEVHDMSFSDSPSGNFAESVSTTGEASQSGPPTGQVETIKNELDKLDKLKEEATGEVTRARRDKDAADRDAEQAQQLVRLTETWLVSNQMYVERYTITAHPKVIFDKSYEKKEQPIMPLWVARYSDVGGFYGRGYAETLIPINAEIEAAMENLFTNVQELDNYGILCVPTGLGITAQDFNVTGRPKIVWYSADPIMPQERPFNIAPANAGLMPSKIIEMGRGVQDDIAKQSPMFAGDAPGRLDSARSLGLLYEASSVPLTGPIASLAEAFSGIYMAALDICRRNWKQLDLSAASLTDEAIVGVVFDPKSGTINLDQNPIPHPSKVRISVRSRNPVSPEQEKAELQGALTNQVLTPMEFRIEARKRGLDIPVGNPQEWENYRRAVLNVLMLFGDGTTPGEPFLSENDMFQVHMYVISAFMAKPEYSLASPAVRDAFEKTLMSIKKRLGMLPPGTPYPEDQAGMDKQMMDAQGGQGEPGMAPPGGQGGFDINEILQSLSQGGGESPQPPQGGPPQPEPQGG